MNHPKSGQLHCLPAGRLFLLREKFYERFGYAGYYLMPNSVGNLLVLDENGDAAGIIDFTGDGSIECWEDDG